MKKITTLFAAVLIATAVEAQTYSYRSEFGKFTDASGFQINPAGFVYVADAGSHQVFKYDTLGSLIKYAGGYGWDEGSFDEPSGVCATTLNIYVSDKNNHRIQNFDKDLNYISTLYTRQSDNEDERFGYPVNCTISAQGDLYILDSENNRVAAFDLFGNFIRNFGGYDAGAFQLRKPAALVSLNTRLLVLDSKNLLFFDQYGNGLGSFDHKGRLKNINSVFSSFTGSNDSTIYIKTEGTEDSFNLSEVKLSGYDSLSGIRGSLVFHNKLYILLVDRILVFEKEI